MIRLSFFIFLGLLFCNLSFASTKDQIINKFKLIDNLSFNFKQTIDNKVETGHCVIEYSKKIFCSYKSSFNKILVSNGKSLVIKTNKNNQYYIYPLKRTPLNIILDKNFLVEKFSETNGKKIKNKYYSFSLDYKNNKINIFFDSNSYELLGWQSEDIYQNLVVTYIYNLQTNQKLNKDLFKLPKQHSN